jgi:N,N'-diacetylchitobiose phosphorylase
MSTSFHDALPGDLRTLTNGPWTTALSPAGAGFLAFEGYALSRWSGDRLTQREGLFLYLRDLDDGRFWSVGYQPVQPPCERYTVYTRPESFALETTVHGVEALLTVALAPTSAVELRRVVLRNRTTRPRRLELTSYMEVVLHERAADAAHPAFSKLFVQTEFVSPQQTSLAHRRPRAHDERFPWLAQRLLGAGALSYEHDRVRFVGRGRSVSAPLALSTAAPLSQTVGNVLDPIVSLRRVAVLEPGATATCILVTAAAWTREAVLALMQPWEAEAAEAVLAAAEAEKGAPVFAWHTPVDSAAPYQPAAGESAAVPPAQTPRRFDNGYGGFSPDGSEYCIRLARSTDGVLPRPPLPWCNVVANEYGGFLISESGAGSTWSRNSREHRLTPWYNDPVTDPYGEALYLRDEDRRRFWSPLPGPVANGAYTVRHGFGYTVFQHDSEEIAQETLLFVPREQPVKIVRLRLTNRSTGRRRLSLFWYCRLTLGGLPDEAAASIVTAYDEAALALLARNPEAGAFADGIAFAAPVVARAETMHYSGDRASFLGPYGALERPRAIMHAALLNHRVGAGLDPCFAWQVMGELEPETTTEYAFLLGEVTETETLADLLRHYRRPGAIDRALDEVGAFWRETVSAVQVRTPAPEIDVLVNGWLPYQTLSCRLWARSAFYQSGGAYGFRDQLQDAAALIHLQPELTRRQILLHAAHQFEEGDVLHWWHPTPLEYGIRTRFCDDLLWLPYVTASYIATTGDRQILEEAIGFIRARHLEAGEDEALLVPEAAGSTADLYEHCCRVLDRSLTAGAHGLPLMGSGDWNDGMNRVGREGRGESVWLGFFLYTILRDWLPLCERRGDTARATRYRAYGVRLLEALNNAGWDGAWYRRAYDDDGTPLGSARSDECRIDALAQAWAVLSGAAPPERARAAMAAVENALIDSQAGIIRLLTPPFDRTPLDPGYIKGYVRGVRENGGQYTHAALWVIQAMAELRWRDRAAALLRMLTPIAHSRDAARTAVYQLEPYVVAADIYGEPPYVGRGGWSWYTGSAGWMYRVAVESILGLRLLHGDTLLLKPCIPDSWPGFTVHYRLPDRATRYEITAVNPDACAEAVVGLEMPEAGARGVVEAGAARLPLRRDGAQHRVRVVLGRQPRSREAQP